MGEYDARQDSFSQKRVLACVILAHGDWLEFDRVSFFILALSINILSHFTS